MGGVAWLKLVLALLFYGVGVCCFRLVVAGVCGWECLYFGPTIILWDIMEVVVDSKNRIVLPRDVRERLKVGRGSTVRFVEVDDGFKIVKVDDKAGDVVERLNRVLLEEPRRTGKPENWGPRRMKSIWVG